MESSSSHTLPERHRRWLRIGIILTRIVVGATFIFSGWTKSIDLWGFIFKVREYLVVWDWNVPYEAIVIGCAALAIAEFTTGVCIAGGCLRRVAVWVAAAMMLFLLPLTVYIAIANPVNDCGCFGDFLIISNTATLIKNIVLAALIIILLRYNTAFRGIYPPPIQWLVIVASCAYPMYLCFEGYRVQPLMDTRPFQAGTYLFEPDAAGGIESEVYIYEKDGNRVAFSLFDVPDSTWTFVETVEAPVATPHSLTLYDEDGFIATDLMEASEGERLYIVINHPGMQYLSSAHFTNELADFAEAHGVETIGLIAMGAERLKPWRELMRPHFPLYSVEDTSLKELVRGNVAAVYTHDGIIKWKSTLSAIDSEITTKPTSQNLLASVEPVDDGRRLGTVTLFLVGSLLLLALLGLSPKFLRLFVRKNVKN